MFRNQLKNGKISSDEFKRKVQGQDFVDVRIVDSSSLTEMSVSVIAEVLHRNYRGEDPDRALENIELPDSLKKDVLNTYNVIRSFPS